jgi:Na+-driven multidrug efflux pump
MYQGLLHTHNLLRWVVLIFAFVAIYRYVTGLTGKKTFKAADNLWGALYVGSLHLQLLIGLVLYFFLSPITKVAMSDMGRAMKDAVLRFWGVEHITIMILAVIIAQVGRTISKKRQADDQKFRIGAVYFIISLLLILMSIPWPFREQIGRSWFPGM